MNKMKLSCKIVSDNKIEYEYKISGEWRKYFTDEIFYAEYSIALEKINDSIAIIPALGVFLPVAWVFDAEITVDEVDEMFFTAIPGFKKGYADMYPQIEFKGNLNAVRVVKNETMNTKSAALFSGGADAFNTMLMHIDEKPELITIWGADINDCNKEGWDTVEKHRKEVLKTWGLYGVTIKSSFRKALEEGLLSTYTLKNAGDNWWHGFQHGLSMLALTAPLAYERGYKIVYIASSYTRDDIGNYTCASDPTIDNYVKFCGCSVVHDGYELCRQDKIRNICEYAEKNNIKIPLRVCWESADGANCCKCEKCARTMLAIYAERKNPKDFGFECDRESFFELTQKNSKVFRNGNFKVPLYDCIQKRLRENYKKDEINPTLRWLYTTDTLVVEKRLGLVTRANMIMKKTRRVPGKILRALRIR